MSATTYIYVCVILAINSAAGIRPINGRVKITVGTTAGSRDTGTFIHEQLLPVYREYGEFLDIEFVPWGRTARDVNDALVCQFGKRDCVANNIHRCVLNLLKDNQRAQVNYMACEYSRPFPAYALLNYRCGLAAGLRLIDMKNCVVKDAVELSRAAEEAARRPMQLINFVPSISINDRHDSGGHNAAIQGLKSMISEAFVPTTTAPATTNW